jgi:hypothetical protein
MLGTVQAGPGEMPTGFFECGDTNGQTEFHSK